MRLDIALVDRGGRELAFHHDRGCCKPGGDITIFKQDPLGDIRRLVADRLAELHCPDVFVQNGCVRFHRVANVENHGKWFVFDDNLSGASSA